MSLSPEDVLNKKKSLNKRIDIENIKLDDVNVDDYKIVDVSETFKRKRSKEDIMLENILKSNI